MNTEELWTIAGQIMLLVGIAGLLMQIGRWLQARNVPTERAHFIVIVSVVVLMGITTIILFTQQTDSLHALETEILQNERLIVNVTHAIHQQGQYTNDILKELHYHVFVQSARNETRLLQQLQDLITEHQNGAFNASIHVMPPNQAPILLPGSQTQDQSPLTHR